jgi:hypothetical protein
MLDISKLVKGLEAADVRAAIYYASRYIKQAENFDKYSKDIFEDEKRSAPNPTVRRLALNIIEAIEADEGMKAANLNFDRVVEVLDHITSFERDLLTSSDAELAAADEFIANIGAPRTDD